MFKVYLVDDDIFIIDEIKTSIQWLENGFEVIGSNSNPLLAIDEILISKPHVVFTDLKMPKIDGIELIKTLKNKGLECEFVILSAYGSFHDSREFFLLDGFDYLLKPIQQIDISILLERLGRKLSKTHNIYFNTIEPPAQSKSFINLVSYISSNIEKKHTLEKLSSQFSLNPNYICNLFAKHYQSTFTTYLTSLRMNAASKQITTTKIALKEIAIDCGYNDYYYFCKVFKEYFGCSPSQYRGKNEEDRFE